MSEENKLLSRISELNLALNRVQSKVEFYEYILSFYADKANWGWKRDNALKDRGEKAREALKNDSKK